jgi:hypothetical protein
MTVILYTFSVPIGRRHESFQTLSKGPPFQFKLV